jgi:hypothetical protein
MFKISLSQQLPHPQAAEDSKHQPLPPHLAAIFGLMSVPNGMLTILRPHPQKLNSMQLWSR